MEVLINKTLMNLLIWVLRLVDGIFAIFKQLAGLEKVQTVDGDVDLMSAFLQSNTVTKVFYSMVVIAAVVCAVSMIVAIVKAMVNLNDGERKSIARITGQGLSVIFVTLAMAGIMVCGVIFASTLLREVHAAFGNDDKKLSSIIFNISVGGYTKYTPEYDDLTTPPIETYENPVWEKDSNGEFVLDESGNKIRVIFGYKADGGDSAWAEGKSIVDFENIGIDKMTADIIYGVRKTNLVEFEKAHSDPDKTQGYLIELNGFNFLIGYFSGVILLVAVCSACLGLVKRLYDIVILFLSLPLMVATIPLDDGTRFKVWRETVVSKVVIAYGAVIAVNVFLLFVPIINSITFESGEAIFKMLLLVGGGLSISGGTLLFARLFGTDAAESRDLAQSARTLITGGMAAKSGLEWAREKAGLKKDREGNRTGLLGFTERIFGKNKKDNSLNGAVRRELGFGGGAYTGSAGPNAMPDSALGKAMAAAGVKQEVSYRDTATGRYISPARAAEIGQGGNSQPATATTAAPNTPSNSNLKSRMKFKNPVQQK